MKLPLPAMNLHKFFPALEVSKGGVDALRQAFFRVFDYLDMPHFVAGGAWHYLYERYNEAHRHYHTVDHLIQMFNGAHDLGILEELTPGEALAIFYHDVIYEVGDSDNEVNSAEVTVDLAQASTRHENESSNYLTYACDTAANIIRDTAHFLDKGQPPNGGPNSLLVMDLDLCSLAGNWFWFNVINERVRKEVGISKKRHAKFLTQFLERDFIYRTEVARAAWEDRARDNLIRYASGEPVIE